MQYTEFLQNCADTTPFDAFVTLIGFTPDVDVVTRLPDETIQLVKDLASHILKHVSAIVKGPKVVHPFALNEEHEIPMHSTRESGAVAGNHASGNDRKMIAVVVNCSSTVLCKQAESNESQVRECSLNVHDIIMIYPRSIHAFGMPQDTDLLLFPDKKWAPPLPESTRELIPWDAYEINSSLR